MKDVSRRWESRVIMMMNDWNRHGGRYGAGQQRQMGYTQAGYRQIVKVSERDRAWRVWKILSQILVLALAGIAAYVAYGVYRGDIVWRWVTVYWIILTAKNLCDFMAGRLK